MKKIQIDQNMFYICVFDCVFKYLPYLFVFC